MVDIPIRVTGQGLETFDRIDQGFRKVRKSGEYAAQSIKGNNGGALIPGPLAAPGGAPMGSLFRGVNMGGFGQNTPAGWNDRSNPRGGMHAGGAHYGGFRHMFHGLSRGIGGVAGAAGERLGGLSGLIGGMGAFGAGLAAAGLAVNAFVASAERAASQVKAIFDNVGKYAAIARQSAIAKGQMGLEAAGQGGGLRQLANQGLLGKFEAARAGGFTGSAESFASLRGDPTKLKAVQIATQLGMDADEAAKMAMHLGKGMDAEKAGRFIAQRGLGRPITDAEFRSSQRNQGTGVTAQLNKVAALQGLTANTKLSYLKNGDAVTAARRGLSEANNPAAQPMADLAREAREQVELLQKQAEAAGRFSEALKVAGRAIGMSQGSFSQQAQDAQSASAAAELPQP